MIFLAGKRDVPADGVQDYCEYLGQALERRGIQSEIAHADWDSQGWVRALRKLRDESKDWRGRWVILQYTALAWSRRGFPFGALAALAIAKRCGARSAVVFHEPFGFRGARAIGRIREVCQNWVIRKLHARSDLSVFPDPLETVRWLPKDDAKAIYIPIGANIPDEAPGLNPVVPDKERANCVAIYCLSEAPHLHRELVDIADAVRVSASGGLKMHVVFLGRGTAEAEAAIRQAFDGIPAEVTILGIQNPQDIRRTLTKSDVMLCVRGPLYPRRGSALTGVACGLPIVAYGGAAEGTPMAEAGVELVPYGDRHALGAAVRRIFLDKDLWRSLHERSLQAHDRYFSWGFIAQKFDEALTSGAGEGQSAENSGARAGK